jgi:hypothetical protein
MKTKYRIIRNEYQRVLARLAKDTIFKNCHHPYEVEIKKWWGGWSHYDSFLTEEDAKECIRQLKAGINVKEDRLNERIIYEDE